MKKRICTACGIILLSVSVCNAQILNKLKTNVEKLVESAGESGLTEDEVAAGLKEAITQGVTIGVERLSKADGYFKDPEIKIPLPKEAKDVETTLRQMGQDKKVDEAIESLNRAAENAAYGAKDIFVTAIKNLTLTDAMGILNGRDDAATQYLNKTTRSALVSKFETIIKISLDNVGATKHWNTVFSTYNKIPLVKKVNPDLSEYVTNKAIDGLFIQIAKQELEIRKNPAARVTDLLKKVFGG
mgnify:CR=1 FL=1